MEKRIARTLLDEALSLAPTHRGLWLVGATLIGLALADALDEAAESAASRLGAIDAMRVQFGLAIPVHYQARIDRATALAELALGQEAYAVAWEAGRADPRAVIDAALDQSTAKIAPSRNASLAAQLGLSRRECEVLTLLIDGCSDRAIAANLFISVRTASTHVSSILHKLKASSRAEAAVHAVRLGLA